MVTGMIWQSDGNTDIEQQVKTAVAYAKDKYNHQPQRVDVALTAVPEETTIAGVKVRPSVLILPGTLYVIWEGA